MELGAYIRNRTAKVNNKYLFFELSVMYCVRMTSFVKRKISTSKNKNLNGTGPKYIINGSEKVRIIGVLTDLNRQKTKGVNSFCSSYWYIFMKDRKMDDGSHVRVFHLGFQMNGCGKFPHGLIPTEVVRYQSTLHFSKSLHVNEVVQ